MKKLKDIFKNTKSKIREKFKRSKKKTEEIKVDESLNVEELKVKFSYEKKPRLIVSSKKSGLIATLSIIIPVLIVGAGTTLGIISANKEKVNKVVEVTTNKENRVVYLLDSDNLIVPITFKVDAKASDGERYLDTFDLMRIDNELNISNIRGYVPKEAKVNSFNLDGSNLTINLSKEFLNYEEKYDYKMMQAMTFSYLEFDGIKSVTYLVDGLPMERLKNSKVALPNEMTSEIGINQQFTSLDSCVNGEDVIVYYQKNYGNNAFLIPVSQTVEKEDTRVESVYSAMKKTISPILGLKKISEYEFVNVNVKPYKENDTLCITVHDEAKLDEVTIKRSVYEIIKLTLEKSDIDDKVSLIVDGETCQVDGYYDQDSVSVMSFTYNNVAI